MLCTCLKCVIECFRVYCTCLGMQVVTNIWNTTKLKPMIYFQYVVLLPYNLSEASCQYNHLSLIFPKINLYLPLPDTSAIQSGTDRLFFSSVILNLQVRSQVPTMKSIFKRLSQFLPHGVKCSLCLCVPLENNVHQIWALCDLFREKVVWLCNSKQSDLQKYFEGKYF